MVRRLNSESDTDLLAELSDWLAEVTDVTSGERVVYIFTEDI